MDLKSQNILMVTRTMGEGGTENVVMQLCETLLPHVNKIVVASSGGVHERELAAMGIRHVLLPDITDKRPGAASRIIKTLRETVKEENITIVHSHHRMAALYAQFLPGNITKIATAHNTFPKSFANTALTKAAYRNTELIAVGEAVRKNLRDDFGIKNPVWRVQKERVTVIRNTVKPFDGNIVPVPEIEKAKTEGKTCIGNVGRLSRQKGMDLFIAAAAGVHKEFPDTHFFIAGSGEEEESLKQLVSEFSAESYITFLGYRSDAVNVMAQMDFMVLSSRWEGLPLTPIEAFSAGKTIVATDVDGTGEIVSDGLNGILVPFGKKAAAGPEVAAAGIKFGILRMLGEEGLREKLEEGAARVYKNKFSYDGWRKRSVDFYKRICLLQEDLNEDSHS